MPLSNLLKSAAGTCPFCHQKAGIPSREHPECRWTYQAGWRRALRHAAADGSITHEEEIRLRRFRDRLGLNRSSAHASATAQPNLTSRQRLTGLTQAAAATIEDGDRLLKQLSDALRKAGFG